MTAERSAELEAQANAALNAVLARVDITLNDYDARLVARMMWDAGYIAGMEWFKSLTDDAFARLRAEA